MADVLVGLLDALELGVVDLLGWSMGGEVAQWVGLKHPQRVRRLVLAGTSPGQVTEGAADPRVPDHAGNPTVTAEDEMLLFFSTTARRAPPWASRAWNTPGRCGQLPPVAPASGEGAVGRVCGLPARRGRGAPASR